MKGPGIAGVCAALLVPGVAAAQSAHRLAIYLGANIGMAGQRAVRTDVFAIDPGPATHPVGFTGGIAMTWGVSDRIAIEGSVGYSQDHVGNHVTNVAGEFTNETDFDFVEGSARLAWRSHRPVIGAWHLELAAGPTVGVMVNCLFGNRFESFGCLEPGRVFVARRIGYSAAVSATLKPDGEGLGLRVAYAETLRSLTADNAVTFVGPATNQWVNRPAILSISVVLQP